MDRIRNLIETRIKDLGLNNRGVSLQLGLNHAYMHQFLKKETPATLPEEVREGLARVLGVQERDLKDGNTASLSRSPPVKPNFGHAATVDMIPVLGMAEGGKDGFDLWNGDVVATLPRPVVLSGVPNAYGVYVVGVSMEPRYHPGELLYINPGKPPQNGNYVLVQMWPAKDGEAPPALVKRLIKRTPTKVTLAQFNPAKTFDIAVDQIKSMHRIVGSADA